MQAGRNTTIPYASISRTLQRATALPISARCASTEKKVGSYNTWRAPTDGCLLGQQPRARQCALRNGLNCMPAWSGAACAGWRDDRGALEPLGQFDRHAGCGPLQHHQRTVERFTSQQKPPWRRVAALPARRRHRTAQRRVHVSASAFLRRASHVLALLPTLTGGLAPAGTRTSLWAARCC